MVKENSQIQEYKYPVAIVSLAILAAIIVLVFMVRPLFNDIQEQSRIINEKRLVLEKKEEKLKNLKLLSEKEELLKKENERVLAALPNDNEVARLFVQLERIAAESGLTIQSVSGGSAAEGFSNEQAADQLVDEFPIEPAGPEIVAISYQLSGSSDSYQSFKNTLAKMETALRILNISEFSISGESQGAGDFSVSLTINTYKRG